MNAQPKPLGLNLKSQENTAECDKPVGAMALLCILLQNISSSNHGYGGSISVFILFFFLFLPISLFSIHTNVWFFFYSSDFSMVIVNTVA